MSSKWKIIAVGMLILMLVLTAWRASSERKLAEAAEHSLAAATSTIHDMTTRQRDVTALDSKYTQELTDAKATIDDLQRAVAAGDKRLRVNAASQCILPPAPPAWMMLPGPNSTQTLDKIITISESN